jgi:hypothetical protein
MAEPAGRLLSQTIFVLAHGGKFQQCNDFGGCLRHRTHGEAGQAMANSTKNGRVTIQWDQHLNGRLRSHLVFEWREIGGPSVVAPGRPRYGIPTNE